MENWVQFYHIDTFNRSVKVVNSTVGYGGAVCVRVGAARILEKNYLYLPLACYNRRHEKSTCSTR